MLKLIFKREREGGYRRKGGAEKERQRSEGFVLLLFYVIVCLFGCQLY